MNAADSFITSHAISRFQEHVGPTASRRDDLRTREILEHVRRRSRQRHWTKVNVRPGCRYLNSAHHTDVCVLSGGAVVTAFPRVECAGWNPSPEDCVSAMPYRRLSANVWQDQVSA